MNKTMKDKLLSCLGALIIYPTLDSIGARFYYDALECDVNWDTIQSFQLIKKRD